MDLSRTSLDIAVTSWEDLGEGREEGLMIVFNVNLFIPRGVLRVTNSPTFRSEMK